MPGSPLFGKLFRIWRESKGISQQEIAKRLHYDQKTISNYERGKITPTGDFLARLALEYDISEEEVEDWIQAIATDLATELLTEYLRVIGNQRTRYEH